VNIVVEMKGNTLDNYLIVLSSLWYCLHLGCNSFSKVPIRILKPFGIWWCAPLILQPQGIINPSPPSLKNLGSDPPLIRDMPQCK